MAHLNSTSALEKIKTSTLKDDFICIYIYTHTLVNWIVFVVLPYTKWNKGFVQALTWFMVLTAYVLGKIKITLI